MQQSPSEIKEKLLRALDTEYNVVDMVTVVEIITVLERTPITKEALETTRLGKYINELRRKTKNELLAKRAKDLVRRWRDMILPTQASDSSVNGKTVSQPTSPDPPVEAVPRTHAANKRLRKEDSPDSKSEEPVTKIARLNGSTVRPIFTPETSRDGFNSKSDNELVPQEIINIDDEPEVPTGPKKRGRKKGSKNKSTLAKAAAALAQKSTEDIVQDKIVALARTPKVKTTQELLADLRSRSGEEIPLVKLPQSIENKASLANCVLTKLEPHEDEDDGVDIKSDHKSLTKQECDNNSNNVNVVVIDKEKKSKKHKHSDTNRSEAAQSMKSSPPPPPVPPEPSSVEEILSRLPPLNLDAIDWSEDSYSVPNSPRPVCEEDVEQLHTEHCEGLNGNWEKRDDQKTEFREWHEMLTIRSSSNESEPPLFVLPYAVVD